MGREEILEKELNRIKSILIKDCGVKKIIVFGSYAQNIVNEYSDLDIMIIKDTEKKFLKRIKEVMLLTNPEIAVDFLVYNEEEIKNMYETGHSFFLEEILKKGKVIYEREAV